MKQINLLTVTLLCLLGTAGCASKKEPVVNLPAPEQTAPIWGDGAEKYEEFMDVVRVTPESPSSIGAIYYSATPPKGTIVESPAFAQGRISVKIIDKEGKAIPIIQSGGEYYIQSVKGEPYTVFFENISNTGYEIVLTADGIDSVSGKDGRYSNPGYILFPGSSIKVKGFRQTRDDYKPFVFYEKLSPYVVGSNEGSDANIGVIGFALFDLQTPKIAKEMKPKAFPAQTNLFRLDR